MMSGRHSTPICAATAPTERLLLGPHLKATSRSFYLSLRILPKGMRRAASLAYLLARIADTVADSWDEDSSKREELLHRFRSALASAAKGKQFTSQWPSPRDSLPRPEAQLISDIPEAFCLLSETPKRYRSLIGRTVQTLTDGMLFDLKRFPARPGEAPAALETLDEFDRYTYLIAGCVGEFWTDLALECRVWERESREKLLKWAVRFGKGLQVINILRDFPSDLKRGRVYLPREDLSKAGLNEAALHRPETRKQLHPLFQQYIGLAREHLSFGKLYTASVPRRHWRLRLSCIWPLWIGLSTLQKLETTGDWLAEAPVRIERSTVYRLMALSVPAAVSDTILARVERSL